MNQAQPSDARPKPLYIPVIVMCAGALLAAFGMLGSVDPDRPVIASKPYWFMYVAGIAVFGFGWCGLRDRWRFGALVLALFLGGAAQLWMTEPLWFPSLRFGPDSSMDLLMIALIVAQGIVTAYFLFATGALGAIDRFISAIGPFRILVFLGLSAFFALSPLGYLSYGGYFDYITHLIGAAAMIALNLCTVAAMLRTRDPGLGNSTFHPIVPAAFAFAASLLLALFAFERLPHVEDEVAFLFQA